MNYDTNAIRQFILKTFDDEEFRHFCFDYFRDVAIDLTTGMTFRQMVQLLLEYCERHDQMEALMVALQRERTALYQEQFAPVQPAAPPTMPQRNPRQMPRNSFIHEKSGLEFVRIPAGNFLYGEKKETIYLPEYWIGKTPVTQAHYQRFITANPGYNVPFYDGDWAKLDNWDRQNRTYPQDKANHPVVLVSWHDAAAFCEWAGLRLPTEEEWEKAARGTDGRTYPWGNNWRANHSNSSEADIRGTSQVGYFSPQGDSPYGCVDMSGNVWEWTDSWYDESQYGRVLRGGFWHHSQRDLRVSVRRHRRLPHSGDHYFGFRLVAPALSGS